MATAGTFSYIVDSGLNITNNLTRIDSITYSASISNSVLFNAATFSNTVILPKSAQAGVGKKITIHIGASGSTVIPSNGDTVNGTSTFSVTTFNTFYADGISNWFTV